MRKSLLIVLSCIMLTCLILTGCSGATTTTQTMTATQTSTAVVTTSSTATQTATTTVAQINIRIGGGMPPGHAISVSILDWKNKVEAATKGRVAVTFYEAGTMGKSTELYDLCASGTLDAVHMAEFWAGGRFPITEGIDNMPFTFTSIDQQTKTIYALIDRGLSAKEVEPFKLLYFTSVGTVNVFTAKTKIVTMADFKGQKLRASGTNVQTVEALGGTALTTAGDTEYMDIQKGILTGNLTGPDNMIGRKEYEVLKYGVTDPISMGGFFFIMNKNFWNKLPADIQTIIDTINKEESAAHVTAQTAAVAASWVTMKEKGMDIYSIAPDELAKWKVATSSVAANWAKTVNGKGLPGDAVLAAVKELTGK
jgi:TRAP-type transport system periplasmic protein